MPGETEEPLAAEETMQTPQEEEEGEEEQSEEETWEDKEGYSKIKLTFIGDHHPEHPFFIKT